MKQAGRYLFLISSCFIASAALAQHRAFPQDSIRRVSQYISLNVADLLRTDITVQYELILPGNKIGLRFPISYGFRSGRLNPNPSVTNPFPFYRNNVFRAGMDFRVYSGAGRRKVRYVFGPAIHYLRVNGIPADYVTTDPDFMVYQPGNTLRFLFFNGIQIRPVEFIQLGFDYGQGLDYDLGSKSYNLTGTAISPRIQINLHVGYRF
jgi:hypothetical protein